MLKDIAHYQTSARRVNSNFVTKELTVVLVFLSSEKVKGDSKVMTRSEAVDWFNRHTPQEWPTYVILEGSNTPSVQKGSEFFRTTVCKG